MDGSQIDESHLKLNHVVRISKKLNKGDGKERKMQKDDVG